MRTMLQTLCFLILGTTAAAQLKSPFPSSVPGITIRNTHEIVPSKILRGMAPLNLAEAKELVQYGITDVLIFRNDNPGETSSDDEKKLLRELGYGEKQIHHIPFKWKDISSFEQSCQQTIQALKLLKAKMENPKTRLFFHCTVGEDRTGYLAGLFRIVLQGKSPKSVFEEEMCLHGFAEGDPNKPDFVVRDVHKNITVVYLKMLALIESGQISKDHLEPSVCRHDPSLDPEFAKKLSKLRRTTVCKPQKISKS